MFTFGIASTGGGTVVGFDPLALLLMALALEAYIGEARWVFRFVPHPVVLIGRLIGWLDNKLNREHRPETDRAIRGAFAVLIVVIVTGGVGWVIAWMTRYHHLGWIIEFAGLIALLAGRGLYDACAG